MAVRIVMRILQIMSCISFVILLSHVISGQLWATDILHIVAPFIFLSFNIYAIHKVLKNP